MACSFGLSRDEEERLSGGRACNRVVHPDLTEIGELLGIIVRDIGRVRMVWAEAMRRRFLLSGLHQLSCFTQ